jgi:hypothetical protein
LENTDTEVDINEAYETVRENIKISAERSLAKAIPVTGREGP